MTPISISRPPAAAAFVWIKEGWNLFKQAPVPWMGMTALVFMVILGISMIPVLGRHLIEALSPFLVAGYFSASRAGLAGETVSFVHLAAGLRGERNSLLRLGLIYMVCSLLIFLLVKHFTGGDLQTLLQQTENPADMTPELANQIVATALPALTLAMLLFTPLIMATWFSPGLALFDGFAPWKAMWWSLWACWVNWRPLLYYSLVMGLFGMVAIVIPYGLGMLVFLPVTLISTYVAYCAIFTPIEDPITRQLQETA
jgi:uncharacterized membrane protein